MACFVMSARPMIAGGTAIKSESVTAPQSATNHFKGRPGFPPNNTDTLVRRKSFTIGVGLSLVLGEIRRGSLGECLIVGLPF